MGLHGWRPGETSRSIGIMSDIFDFISSCGGCNIALPAFATDPDCVAYTQKRSQVTSLIVFPWLATKPTDWTVPGDWAGLIDNTNTDDTKAKKIVGIGSFVRASSTDLVLASERRRVIFDRVYELRFRVLNMLDGHITFAKKLQCDFKNYEIFLETVGGRLLGQEGGIRPFFVDAFIPFEGENISLEYIEIVMQFRLNQAIEFVDSSGIESSTEDMQYYQAYPSQVSNSMTFAGSSGVLPSNTDAACFLYQNGRKLPTVHYTLTPGASDVTITVDASIHFSGASYEFIINT